MMVSLCKKKPTNYYFNKPLPKGVAKNRIGLLNEHKEMPSCTHLKASYSVEAAVIVPLVVGFWMCIMLFFRILQIQTEVTQALDYAGRMTAVESSEVESENALLISAKGFFLSEIRNYDLIDKYVYGGKPGISILQSDMSGDHIELVANYKIKFPINFFNIGIISLEQHGYHRKWTGKQLTSSEDEYVYYTDTGEVYHLTSTCNYLDLSIHTANYSQIGTLRNRSNHRYSACSCAVANISANSTVYITDYGIRYHSNLHCSGLKRTIHMVRRSEVGNRRLCSKCARAANQ